MAAVITLVTPTIVVHLSRSGHIGSHSEVAEGFRFFFRITRTASLSLTIVVLLARSGLVVVLIVMIFVLVPLMAFVVTAVLMVRVCGVGIIVTSVVVVPLTTVLLMTIVIVLVIVTILIVRIIAVLAMTVAVIVAALLRMARHDECCSAAAAVLAYVMCNSVSAGKCVLSQALGTTAYMLQFTHQSLPETQDDAVEGRLEVLNSDQTLSAGCVVVFWWMKRTVQEVRHLRFSVILLIVPE